MRHLRADDAGTAPLCGPVDGATYADMPGELECWLCATIAGLDLEEVEK